MRTVTREQIRDILAEHYDYNLDNAADAMCDLLGIATSDTWEFAGWTVTRRSGEFFGRRGRVRELHGWQAIHNATGDTEDFPPDSSIGDFPPSMVKIALDQKNQLRELRKQA